MASRSKLTVTAAPEKSSLTARQQVLLGLLHALGGTAQNLDFQKFLFLYCQEPDAGGPYEFVPYKRGAFSFTSYADRRKLIAHGLLEDDEQRWRFTAKGQGAVEPDMLIDAFVADLGSLAGDQLIAHTYRLYPYYAINSEVAGKVLKGDRKALDQIKAAQPQPETHALQTIGYEGRTLEGYLNTLIQAGVTVLCDVRRNPISRKYGFAKSTLAHACEGVGIQYEHLPELGIPSDQRQDLSSQSDYDALFDVYEREHLPKQTAALQTIQDWIKENDRVALTCYELLPHQCHRHCVAEALENLSNSALKASHL